MRPSPGTQPGPFDNHSPFRHVLATVIGCWAILLFACGDGVQLETVAAPENLEQLAASVKSQFLSRRKALDELTQSGDRQPERLGKSWGELGQWYQAYQYPASAMACYRNAQRLDTKEAQWPYLLGRLTMLAGDLEAAQTNLERALSLEPLAEAPRVALGDLACDRQDAETGAMHYREALKLNPHSPGGLMGLAKLCLAREEAKAALSYLELLEDLQPEATQVHYLSATAWMQLGNTERANLFFAKVPEDNNMHRPLIPNDPWMQEIHNLNQGGKELTRQGMIALRKGEHEKAAVLAGRAVGENPENVDIRVNYAVTLKLLGRTAAAVEQVQAALAMDSEHGRAHLVLGSLMLEHNRPAAAERHLKKALAADPRSSEVNLQLGKLYQRQERLSEAVAHYASVRQMDGTFAGARFWNAALLMALDKSREAFTALEEDLVLIPEERALRLLRIRLLAAAPEEGLREGSEARRGLLEVETDFDVFYAETAAMTEAENGNFQLAVAWQRAVLDALSETKARASTQIARRRLELYHRKEPCRKPWEVSEAMVQKPVRPPDTVR